MLTLTTSIMVSIFNCEYELHVYFPFEDTFHPYINVYFPSGRPRHQDTAVAANSTDSADPRSQLGSTFLDCFRDSPYIGLIYGRYLHFRILKFPLKDMS